MLDRQIVGVGKNESLETAPAQIFLQGDHLRHFRKNIGEVTAKFIQPGIALDRFAYRLVKFLAGEPAGFVVSEQGRTSKEGMQVGGRLAAAVGYFTRGDGVV